MHMAMLLDILEFPTENSAKSQKNARALAVA